MLIRRSQIEGLAEPKRRVRRSQNEGFGGAKTKGSAEPNRRVRRSQIEGFGGAKSKGWAKPNRSFGGANPFS